MLSSTTELVTLVALAPDAIDEPKSKLSKYVIPVPTKLLPVRATLAVAAYEAEVAVSALPSTVGTLKTPVVGLNVILLLSSVLTIWVPAAS